MNLQIIGLPDVLPTPYLRQQCLVEHDVRVVLGQMKKQSVLGLGQLDVGFSSENAVSRKVELEISLFKRRAVAAGGWVPMPFARPL